MRNQERDCNANSPSKPQYESSPGNCPPWRSDRNLDSNSPACLPTLQNTDNFLQYNQAFDTVLND
jgi:hypothetical protein